MEIRKIIEVEALYDVQDLETEVWGSSPVPIHQMYTAIDNGGMLLGAYKNERLIGYLYSFPGYDGKDIYLCSHQMGIIAGYRKSGIGELLKKRQFQLAKEQGYAYVRWTFDPLESVNAYLNLHKLQATGVTYRENYYGMLKDGLNDGMPSDRMVIHWYLSVQKERKETALAQDKILLKVGNNDDPIRMQQFHNDSDFWLLEIPENIQIMKGTNKDQAGKWRVETRDLFQQLFANDYYAVDMIRDHGSYYVFSK